MRILMTTCPQYGHFYPLVPLGWALRGAGHEVRVAVPENFVDIVAQAGLPAAPVGGVVRTRDIMEGGKGELLDAWAADPAAMHVRALRLVSRFALHLAEPIVSFCQQWSPDLVLHPTLDFSGPLVASVLGVPAVSLSPGLPIAQRAMAAAHDELADLYGAWGYQPAETPAAVRLETWPTSLLAHPGQPMRYVPYNGPETMPTWLLGRPVGTSRACVTLGSILPKTGGLEVLPALITALHDLLEQVVIVLPHEAAKALTDLITLPAGVHLADTVAGPWLALNLAAEGSALLVHHGGAGTTQTAFSMGIPQLVIPRMADQFDVANAVVRSGAGRALQPSQLTPETVREAAADLITDARYRQGAARVQGEMAAQPHPGQVAAMLEELIARPGTSWSRPCG
ncbi:DUF1205 domain-containing protein [Streptomyces sp. NBC_01283]|uniref:nucleotide disphospho-sugar-binding domain-containing protein n=1 Tax=Streptomyces sp. NBC_01283 TaxID=2903812 RepID=UPI00352CFE5A|nr:DUF1205 domain-containing protein [Streptomyces sp. NBC_01283]